jgi:hypothetical protein
VKYYSELGYAMSEVALYGSGIVATTVGISHTYSARSYYGGSSDFLCYEVRQGNHLIVVNSPGLTGALVIV